MRAGRSLRFDGHVINGAHVIVFSTDAERDRQFLRDVLGFGSVDAGDGWLIFGLPPAELAVHPGDQNDQHELYFMTDDLAALRAELASRDVECPEPVDQGWGIVTRLPLPGGGTVGVYQPRHERPPAP